MPSHPSSRRLRHRAASIALIAGLAAGAVACAPDEPEPDPTPTGFASEEEALEAARATYEGYVNATNDLVFAEAETAEAVYDWLVDEALASERETIVESQAEALSRSGAAVVELVELSATSDFSGDFDGDACVNVSDVDITDASGDSLVSPDRPDVLTIRLTFVPSNTTSTGLAISVITGRDDGASCEPS